MPKKRPGGHVPKGSGPVVRTPARNERYRRPPDQRPRWLLAAGAAVAVLAIGWWAFQGWSKPPTHSTANTGGDQTIVIGAQAPTVALASTSGGQVSLDQYRGSRVVVYFYEGVG